MLGVSIKNIIGVFAPNNVLACQELNILCYIWSKRRDYTKRLGVLAPSVTFLQQKASIVIFWKNDLNRHFKTQLHVVLKKHNLKSCFQLKTQLQIVFRFKT